MTRSPSRNLEIKARVGDLAAVRPGVEALAGSVPERLHQEDTFFHVPRGRLKLRRFADGTAELIFYERPDAEGPARSEYVKTPCPDPTATLAALGRALGVRGVVRKRRDVYLAGRTRIHLDRVEGLGDFIEIEVVLGPGDNERTAAAEAEETLRVLGVDVGGRLARAYIDLL